MEELKILKKDTFHQELNLISKPEDGNDGDFEISISQLTVFSDGQHIFQLLGLIENEPTQKFCIYLQTKCVDYLQGGDNGEKLIIDAVALRPTSLSFDKSGENFPRYIAKLFSINQDNFQMKDMVELDFVYLTNKPLLLKELLTQKVELKLFYKRKYYEWYLTIDFPRKRIAFIEKDKEYRQYIFESLIEK